MALQNTNPKVVPLEEQLAQLSPEQLEQLKQELIKQRGDPVDERIGQAVASRSRTPGEALARGVGRAGTAIGEGALLGLQGRPISELSISGPKKLSGLEELLQREQLKNVTDPTRMKSQLELEEIERLKKDQGNNIQNAEAIKESGGTSTDVAKTAEKSPTMFISVPKGRNKFGIIEYDTIKNPEFEAFEERRKIENKRAGELKSDVIKGQLVNTNNLNLLGGVTRDLSQVYADSFEEGGAGGFLQATKGKLATKFGDLPEGSAEDVEIGGKFSASGAFPGKRMELILKMMPMLTQQATKPEGSVRLITGVLDALGKTIPELGTAPRTADRQLSESLQTFYRFARTAEQLGLSVDEAFSGKDVDELGEDEITAWAQQVASQAGGIVIEGEEKQALESLLEQSLAPIRDIRRGKEDKGTGQKIGRFTVEVE